METDGDKAIELLQKLVEVGKHSDTESEVSWDIHQLLIDSYVWEGIEPCEQEAIERVIPVLHEIYEFVVGAEVSDG